MSVEAMDTSDLRVRVMQLVNDVLEGSPTFPSIAFLLIRSSYLFTDVLLWFLGSHSLVPIY
jgi:hypothetical protein